MLTVCYLLYENKDIGGMIANTAGTVLLPVPGSGVILAPITNQIGQNVGGLIGGKSKTKSTGSIFDDSLKIYRHGSQKNKEFTLSDQKKSRELYQQKAKQLGYNKAGQVLATIDPTLVSVVPNAIIKNSSKKSSSKK